MSAVNAPFGFKPVMQGGHAPHGGGVRWYRAGIDTGAIAKGGLVSLSTKANGSHAVAVTAAGVAGTRSVNTVLGVIMGVRYVDANGTQIMGQYMQANAVTAGFTNIFVQVCDDPNAVFEVQANGSLTAADVGQNVESAVFTADQVKKLANTVVASPSVLTTATWRVVDVVEDATNTSGDAFTRIRVRYNLGYHMTDIATGL
jgi:hypothetical protein